MVILGKSELFVKVSCHFFPHSQITDRWANQPRCRPSYIVVLALTIITFVLAAFVAPKSPKLIRFIVLAMQLVLIGAGIGLAFLQWDVRSATFIAAVLIVPVMFVTAWIGVLRDIGRYLWVEADQRHLRP